MKPHQTSKLIIVALVGIAVLTAIAVHFMAPISKASSPTMATNVPMYLLSAAGACRGPTGYSPCFGGNITQAEIFNCTNAATSSSGCTQLVVNRSDALISYRITVWYPYLPLSNEPSWANCKYQSSGDSGQQYFANCISTNSTAFIVTEPSPPPV